MHGVNLSSQALRMTAGSVKLAPFITNRITHLALNHKEAEGSLKIPFP